MSNLCDIGKRLNRQAVHLRRVRSGGMKAGSWQRVDQWWAELMGVPISTLWEEGVAVSTHPGLVDFEGLAVSRRHASVHVVLPEWADAKLVEQISDQEPDQLLVPQFWKSFESVAGRRITGPVVHSYTDQQVDAPRSVEKIEPSTIADWEDYVSRKSGGPAASAAPSSARSRSAPATPSPRPPT